MADSRDDGGDDDLDEPFDDRPIPFPTVVMVAGVIWICVGTLAIIANMAVLGMGAGKQDPTSPGTACCSGLIGLAFVACGYQTVTGKAKDTLGNASGSICLGLLQLLGAALIGFGALDGRNPNQQKPPPEVNLVIAVMVAVMGSILIVAGVLALAGRAGYREWRREYTAEGRRRSRPPRRDEPEEPDDGPDGADDQPWSRGRGNRFR
jgi:hypothetical protein